MGLKSGLYFMIFAPYEDHDVHFSNDDDYYSKWCLGAAFVGEVSGQFRSSYFKSLFERFDIKYGWEQRPFRMDFYFHDGKGDPVYPKNLTEETLLDLVLKYKIMSPDHQEVLDIAVDIADDMRQVIVETDEPIANPGTSKPASKPKLRNNKHPSTRNSKSKDEEKGRESKYEVLTQGYLDTIVVEVLEGITSQAKILNLTAMEVAEVIQGSFKAKIKSVADKVIRTDAWRNRHETFKPIYDTATFRNRKNTNSPYQDVQ